MLIQHSQAPMSLKENQNEKVFNAFLFVIFFPIGSMYEKSVPLLFNTDSIEFFFKELKVLLEEDFFLLASSEL